MAVVAICPALSAPPEDAVRIEKDIDYLGVERVEKADLYLPAKVAPGVKCPAVVIMHGGGWSGGDKGAAREVNIGTTLAEHGYVGLSINYKLAREGDTTPAWPQNLYDCKTAVRWLRKNAERLQLDPEHIGAIGGSAGGHLAAMLAVTGPDANLNPAGPYGEFSCQVQCAVDLYGPVLWFEEMKFIYMFLKIRAEAPELYRQASPVTHADKSDPPILIIHGTADTVVTLANSEALAAALEKAGVKHRLVVVKDAEHSFHLEPPQQDLRPLVLGFFAEHLKSKPKNHRHSMIYDCPGPIKNPQSGWEFQPSKNPGGKVYNEAEGYYPDKGGQWIGPSIPADADEFAFYLLDFEALAPEACYWGVRFVNIDGNPIVADVHSSLSGGAEKRHFEWMVYGREGGASLRPFFQSTKGVEAWDLKLRKISSQSAAEWCDQLYKTLPQLAGTLPKNRLERIPKTVEALKTGKSWRVVMLGDSIVNDTFNSNFQSLLQRQYPKADLKVIASVRGSTGCWYYQDPEQFKKYVTDLRPDLLMIGGISHKSDLEAIRKVIETARGTLGCEVLLMSGPMGKDWRTHDAESLQAALPAQAWSGDLFAERQKQLAEELSVEFIDMAGIWHAYLGASLKPFQWFHRDAVHANDRGKQILGRILEAWFSPGKPAHQALGRQDFAIHLSLATWCLPG